MLSALIEFIHRLRDAAIPISMVEALDATQSLRHIDLSSRAELRAALEAALVKRAEHRASFAALFDVYFASRRTAAPQSGGASPSLADLTGETAGEAASQELLQALLDALRRNDEGALRAIAALAVQQFGGINETRVGSQHYHLYRVLRHLDLSNLLQRVIEAAGEGGHEATLLDDRLFRDEQRHRIEEFRRLLADEIRHRLLEVKGLAAAADMSHTPIEDVDFLGATPAQLREIPHPILRVRRRDRRGDEGVRRPLDPAGRPPPPGAGRRRVGGRTQRLRPCVRAVLERLRTGRPRAEDHGHHHRRRSQQLPRPGARGAARDPGMRPEGLLVESGAAAGVEHDRLDHRRVCALLRRRLRSAQPAPAGRLRSRDRVTPRDRRAVPDLSLRTARSGSPASRSRPEAGAARR